MKKTFQVFRNELVTVIARRSFLLTLFVLPLAGLAIFIVVSQINASHSQASATNGFLDDNVDIVEGYVDEAGLIESLPQSLNGRLVPYTTVADAKIALDRQEIQSYYVIAPNYLDSGQITYVRADYNPLGGLVDAAVIEEALTYNLLGADERLARRFDQPMNARIVAPSAGDAVENSGEPVQERRDPEHALTFMLPYGVTFLFYIIIMGAASLMLNSVSGEKQNRVLEILLTSVTPGQMLLGKMSALALVGLMQTLVWGASGLVLLRLSGRFFQVPEVFQLPLGILLWGALFFLLGYAVYASLMAGAGALVPNIREASSITLVILLPLFVPLLLISVLIEHPDGILAVFLSLFPLTSPVVMMTRLAATSVPLWQLALALVLLLLAAWLVLRSVAGLFRAQMMLSGQPVSIGRFMKVLFGASSSIL